MKIHIHLKNSHAKLYVELKHFMWENLIKFIYEMKVSVLYVKVDLSCM